MRGTGLLVHSPFRRPLPSEFAQGAACMQAPLLFTYRRCPYAMRARMALLHSGRNFDVYEIELRNKPLALHQASPKATVPVLVFSNGQVIDQSLDIMRWALGEQDSGGYWARAGSSQNQSLLHANDAAFKYWLDRYKYPQRYPTDGAQATPENHSRTQASLALLVPLEAALTQSAFLGGGQPCVADWAIFPFVRQFRAIDPVWFDAQPWPAAQRWLHAWLNAPAFLACMQKLPVNQRLPWRPEPVDGAAAMPSGGH